MYKDIREEHTKRLLFRFDPVRDLIEIQQRGKKTIVDLSEHRESADERQATGNSAD
jgi:hypothetical protein